MSSIVIAGDTSGSVTLQAPAVAGTTTLTLPATTATLATLTTPSFATTIGVGGATPSASGAGITFPATQSASSDANTLDDYEEGTWTPQLVGGTTAGTPVNGAGYYTKVGNLVTIFYAFEGVSPPSGGDGILMIRNMPFPLSSSTTVYNYANPSLIFTNGGTSLANMWWGHRADDTNNTRFYYTYYANVNTSPSNFIVTNLGGSGNYLRGYFSYQV